MTRAPLVSALAGLVLAAATTGATAAPAASAAPVRVTVVGDSVAASLDVVPRARAELGRGLDVRLDVRVCRRLVQPSCAYQGSAPPTALDVVRALGRRLGAVLVVKVGYNEGPQGYGAGIDRVMRAARRDGVHGVVWVTLRETLPLYHQTNVAIRRAARRWPQLQVADWNAYSAGRAWFGADGLHLNAAGAEGLARFLRPYVIRAAGA